jgi:hypothetical protein
MKKTFELPSPPCLLRLLFNGTHKTTLPWRHNAEIRGWIQQITLELKQHYQAEGLTDVRVIRDRQTSK